MNERNPQVTRIIYPSAPPKDWKVGIYCRVSTNAQDQLKSIAAQASYFVQLCSGHVNWHLKDIYLDFYSGTSKASRPEFQRMLADVADKKINLVLTKSISRFGRNTVDSLTAMQAIRDAGGVVYFDEEHIYSSEDNDLVATIFSSVAEAHSQKKSESIRWGIDKCVRDGSSRFYNRVCYGYRQDEAGKLVINEAEAENVKLIFQLYLEGYSYIGIQKELMARSIPSPMGKEKWATRTIEKLLKNEKYTGKVILYKTIRTGFPGWSIENNGYRTKYMATDNNPRIISEVGYGIESR